MIRGNAKFASVQNFDRNVNAATIRRKATKPLLVIEMSPYQNISGLFTQDPTNKPAQPVAHVSAA